MSQVNLNGAASALLQGLGLGEQVRSNRERMLFAQQQAEEQARRAGIDDARQQEALDLQRQQFNQRIREFDDQRIQDETRKAANARAFQYLSNPDDTGEDITPDLFGVMASEVASKYAAERGNRADFARGSQEWEMRLAEARKDRSIRSWSPKMWEEAQKYGKFPERGDLPKSKQEQRDAEENATKMRMLADLGIQPMIPTPYGPQPNQEFQQYAGLSLDYLKEIIARKRKQIDAEEVAAQRAQVEAQAASDLSAQYGIPPDEAQRRVRLNRAGVITDTDTRPTDPAGGQRAAIASAKSALDVARQNLSAAAEYADSTEEDDGQERLANAQRDYDAAYARYQAVSSGGVPRGTQAPAQGGDTPEGVFNAFWAEYGRNPTREEWARLKPGGQ